MQRVTLRPGTLIAADRNGVPKRFDLDKRLKYGELSDFGTPAFIVNDNVHRTNSRLGGILVYTHGEIGYIVKAEGSKAIYQPLLPSQGELRFITLYDRNLLPLQQVSGVPLRGAKTQRNNIRCWNEFVTKSSRGPDEIRISHNDTPRSMLKKLSKFSFDVPGDDAKVRGKTKSPVSVPVVYIKITLDQARSKPETAGRNFTLHVGHPKPCSPQ